MTKSSYFNFYCSPVVYLMNMGVAADVGSTWLEVGNDKTCTAKTKVFQAMHTKLDPPFQNTMAPMSQTLGETSINFCCFSQHFLQNLSRQLDSSRRSPGSRHLKLNTLQEKLQKLMDVKPSLCGTR